MGTDITLPERDLARLVQAAGLCREAERLNAQLPTPVEELLDAIVGLVPCDVVFWNHYSLVPELEEHALVGGRIGRTPQRAPLGPWLEHLHEHPIMSGRHAPVTRVSDVLQGPSLEASWLYQEAWLPAGIGSEVGVELTHGAREMSVIVLSRAPGRDFTLRDKLVLELVRPHIDAAMRWATDRSARLTPRERQVLRLVASGLSNAQIAAKLGIKSTTVAKHLEHIYARTGAQCRTEAVALCQQPPPRDLRP